MPWMGEGPYSGALLYAAMGTNPRKERGRKIGHGHRGGIRSTVTSSTEAISDVGKQQLQLLYENYSLVNYIIRGYSQRR